MTSKISSCNQYNTSMFCIECNCHMLVPCSLGNVTRGSKMFSTVYTDFSLLVTFLLEYLDLLLQAVPCNCLSCSISSTCKWDILCLADFPYSGFHRSSATVLYSKSPKGTPYPITTNQISTYFFKQFSYITGDFCSITYLF